MTGGKITGTVGREIFGARKRLKTRIYCADSSLELPHPAIVVLDSPLVTYKRRDFTPGEEISEDVASAFYEALAKLPAGRQVIVLENNDPPAVLHGLINY